MALRYAVWRPYSVKAVILSAPMMAPPVVPVWLIRIASHLLSNIGLSRRHPPFYHVLSLDVVRHYKVENTLTRNPEATRNNLFGLMMRLNYGAVGQVLVG